MKIKISRQIALAKRPAKAFMSETSRYVTNKPWNPGLTEGHDASMPFARPVASGVSFRGNKEDFDQKRCYSCEKRVRVCAASSQQIRVEDEMLVVIPGTT